MEEIMFRPTLFRHGTATYCPNVSGFMLYMLEALPHTVVSRIPFAITQTFYLGTKLQ